MEEPQITTFGNDDLVIKDGFWIPGARNKDGGVAWKVNHVSVFVILCSTNAIRWNNDTEDFDTLAIRGGTVFVLNGETGVFSNLDNLNNAISSQRQASLSMGVGVDSRRTGELRKMDDLSDLAHELHEAAMMYKDNSPEEFETNVAKLSTLWDNFRLARVPSKVHARKRSARAKELVVAKNPSAVAATVIGILNNITARTRDVETEIGPGTQRRESVLLGLRAECVKEMTRLASALMGLELKMSQNLDGWDNGIPSNQFRNTTGAMAQIANSLNRKKMPRPFYHHRIYAISDLLAAQNLMVIGNHRGAHKRIRAILQGLGHMALRQEIESVRFELLVHSKHISANLMCKRIAKLARMASDLQDDELARKRLHATRGKIFSCFYHASNGKVAKVREILKSAGAPL